jgi:hypothetical protein
MATPVASQFTHPPTQILFLFSFTFNFISFICLFVCYLFIKRIHDAFAHVQLSDIRVIATLGVGGFGRVELVQITNDTSRSYGLKQMKKSQVMNILQFIHNFLRSTISTAICRRLIDIIL